MRPKNLHSRAKRRKVAQRQRRRRNKGAIAFVKEIHKAQQEASQRTHAQSNVCFGRVERACKKEKEIAFKRQSRAMTNSKAIPNERYAANASLPEHPTGMQMRPTARSVSHLQTTTRHVALSNDRLQNRSQLGGTDASMRPSPDFASGSSSQARHEMSGDTPGLNIDRRAILSNTHLPLQANDTFSDDSFVLRPRRDTYDFSHKRRKISESSSRKIHLGHDGYVAGGSQDVAHIPRQDLSHPTTSLQTIEEPLNKCVSKERAKPKRAERGKKDLSGLLHTATTDNQKRGLPSKSKTATIFEPNSDEHEDAEKQVETEKLVVNIPADTDMATDVRAYSQWPDDSGGLEDAQGCLLPAKYRFSNLPGFEWICPVRTCRRCYETQKSLGGHFNSMHHSCLLNDNCDGTFTIVRKFTVVRKYTRKRNSNLRPARVKTKNPLPEDAPPPVEARAPATWVTVRQQNNFAEIKKKARLHATQDSSEETVDEMMLLSSWLSLSSAEDSGNPKPGAGSRSPPFRDVEAYSSEPEASSGNGLKQAEENNSDDESRPHTPEHDEVNLDAASHMHCDATQENWRSVEKHLTGGQFSTPKRGHFATLLSSPRTRDIVTRSGETFIADQPKKVRLLMVHMTGEEASVPCDSCALSRGPFKKCVAISKKAAGETTSGIVCCTNCAVGKDNLRHSCNVAEVLGQPPARQHDSPRKQGKEHLTPETREQSSLGISSRINMAAVKVDSRFTFAVYALPLDGSLDIDAEPSSVRLYSLASGKALVELEGISPFLIGPHGMFTLMPATTARLSNASEEVALIHVSTVKS